MLRTRFTEALKDAMRAKDQRAISTVRLILAALKDRDIAARARGVQDGIGEEEILAMLQTMVKQRRESIALYEQGGRCELAEQEREEIAIIEGFMPRQLCGRELEGAIRQVLDEVQPAGLKDMGRVMAALKARYAGQMDFAAASGMVRAALV